MRERRERRERERERERNNIHTWNETEGSQPWVKTFVFKSSRGEDSLGVGANLDEDEDEDEEIAEGGEDKEVALMSSCIDEDEEVAEMIMKKLRSGEIPSFALFGGLPLISKTKTSFGETQV
ncbi:hypothetical protein NE237_000586 [Protea cynaroides]|uniref:Uncharacterized protein n=1 Tax=Protea cynaroides TaxID=273540 RepID=A0A9Q0QXM5_9MAGN|nr:hypothetical protein NE237_000586 [Protea cynaroides]